MSLLPGCAQGTFDPASFGAGTNQLAPAFSSFAQDGIESYGLDFKAGTKRSFNKIWAWGLGRKPHKFDPRNQFPSGRESTTINQKASRPWPAGLLTK